MNTLAVSEMLGAMVDTITTSSASLAGLMVVSSGASVLSTTKSLSWLVMEAGRMSVKVSSLLVTVSLTEPSAPVLKSVVQ